MPREVHLAVHVAPGEKEVTAAAAELFTTAVEQAVATRGVARIAISGGNTPKSVFELLASPEYVERVPWSYLQLFWVDERCVPPSDPESNFGMTAQAMLDHIPLPQENVYRMEGELDPEEGANRYEAALRNAFKLEGAQTPTFDLILLGMGEDGHTASLFPHTDALNELGRLVVANHVPQKDTWRLTLTLPVIDEGRQVAFLVEGESKADILKTVFRGPYLPEDHPSQMIRPASGKLLLLLDVPAASKLELDPHAGAGDYQLELR